jgi:transposase
VQQSRLRWRRAEPASGSCRPTRRTSTPIENAFAKLKALLRKAAARTVEGLWTAVGDLLDAFTPSECANYFTAAGYEPD